MTRQFAATGIFGVLYVVVSFVVHYALFPSTVAVGIAVANAIIVALIWAWNVKN